MDENNNGPVPGIIGQDIPSEPVETTPTSASAEPQDNGKIFDSSEFTGVKQESLTFNADGEEKNAGAKKPKGPNPFTKWQLWAALSGVILVLSVVAIFITISIYDGKLAGAGSVARYDSLSNSIDADKKDFEQKLTEYTRRVYTHNVSSYNLSIEPISEYYTNPKSYIYPTENDIHTAGNDCLKQDIYGLSDEDIAYAETRKTGAELLADGKDVAKEAERLEKIDNAYRAAVSDIESCHDPLIDVKLSDFKIELMDAEETERGDLVDIRRRIKITYNGSKPISRLTLFYGMKDKDGLNAQFHYATYIADGESLKQGDVIETRVCGYEYSSRTSTDKCVYTANTESLKSFRALKPKLVAIYGEYAYK